MKKLIIVLFIIILGENTAFASHWVNFTIARHTDITFAQNTFDTAMTAINVDMKLDNNSCTDDVPCTTRFRRSGALGTFGANGDGLDTITTQAELNAVFAVNTHRIKVVTVVDRCAGTTNPSIIGCGTCNGNGFILESWVGGNVYVHEYGHNVMGCGHRDDCAWNIMNTNSNGANNSVNAAECTGFGGKAYTQLCGNVYDGSGGPLTVANGPYWVTCNVTVPVSQTLTIEAGVEIQFDPGRKITSSGTTNADGTAQQILIYSNNQAINPLPTMTVDGPLQMFNGGDLLMD